MGAFECVWVTAVKAVSLAFALVAKEKQRWEARSRLSLSLSLNRLHALLKLA